MLVVVCSFFEFGTVSKWCIREWIKNIVQKGELLITTFYLYKFSDTVTIPIIRNFSMEYDNIQCMILMTLLLKVY